MISKFFQKPIALANYLAAIALLLSMLCPYVSPINFKYLSLFGLAYPYLIIINVLFVIFWAVLKKPQTLISAIIIAVIIGLYFKNRQSKTTPFETQNELSIMSFNVRVFNLYNWTKNKESRDEIFDFIRHQSPKIICLQEYFNSKNPDYFPVHDSLIRNQKFKTAHIHYTNKINGNYFGIATYSVYPIINKQVYTFEQTNNLFISSDIVINKDTVRIINCHLESIRLNQEDYNLMDSIGSIGEKRHRKGVEGILYRFQQAYVKRAEQADKLNQIIGQSPYPTFCCGDFNDTPNSYTYKKIQTGLSDSFHASKSVNGGTYTRFFPSFRIDFILFSKDIQCLDFKTYNINLSDHKPIKGTYLINSRK